MTNLDDAPDGELRIGRRIAGAFFVGLLGCAALIPLDAGAYSQGVVAVAGKRQAVQHRDGGIVTAIRASEGQLVRRGQVLIEISAGDLRAQERGMTAEMVMLYAQRARLTAERDGGRAVIEPAEFAGLTGEDKELAMDSLRGQRLLFAARRNAIGTEKQVWRHRASGHSETIGGYQMQMDSNRKQRQLLEDELAGMRKIAAKGFASINRIRQLERTQAALDGEFGSYGAQVLKTRDAVDEAKLSSVSLDRRQMEGVEEDLRNLQVRLNEIAPKLQAVREQLARALVRAPTDGVVVGLSVFTVGGVVTPGQLLMDVVPQDRGLVVETQISPADADDLHVGQVTQVRFSTFHDRTLPPLNGKIDKLSADSFLDERSGQRYFRAQVSLSADEYRKVTRRHGEDALKPGLPAEVMVPLKKRSALTYLVGPLGDTIWRGGREL